MHERDFLLCCQCKGTLNVNMILFILNCGHKGALCETCAPQCSCTGKAIKKAQYNICRGEEHGDATEFFTILND